MASLRLSLRPLLTNSRQSTTLLLRNTYATTSTSTTIPTSQTTQSPTSEAPQPSSVSPTASKPKYHILRTPSNQLPIYKEAKAGGTLKQTRIQKVLGDGHALAAELREALGLEEKAVKVNPLNGHVVVKGHKKSEITEFLTAKKF